MAYDRLAQESRLDKLADTLSRHRGIVGDHRQIAFLLPHDLIDETLGRAHGHETADHETCPVRNSGDCLLEKDGLHCPHLRLKLRPEYGALGSMAVHYPRLLKRKLAIKRVTRRSPSPQRVRHRFPY